MTEKNEDRIKKTKGAKQNLEEKMFQAKEHLLNEKYQEAYDTAYSAMTAEKDAVGGWDSIHLLPGYFILVEALMADNKLKKAEEFLTGAYWNFLKTQDGDEKHQKELQKADISKEDLDGYHIQLDKTFAKLLFKKTNYPDALNKLKSAVLMDSKRLGPQNPVTSISYFLMGNIFQAMSANDSSCLQKADAYYSKFVQVWYKYLKSEFKNDTGAMSSTAAKILCSEALINLQRIETIWGERYHGESCKKIALQLIHTNYSLALLCHRFQRPKERAQYIETTFHIAQDLLGENHPKAQKISKELNNLMFEEQDQQGYAEQGESEGEQNAQDT